MSLHDFWQWWNIIYLAPLAVSVLWILASVLGGFDMGAQAHDAGFADVDADVDIDMDVDADVSHSPIFDSPISHSTEHSHPESSNSLSHTLSVLFGIGQAPVSLILGVFLLCWGVFGMAMNQLFSAIIPPPAIYIWPSMGATFILSYAITRTMAAFLGKYLPNQESYGVSRRDLVGYTGVAVYKITRTGGTVDIRDKYGTLHRAQARLGHDQEVVPAGGSVLILEYDSKEHFYTVKAETGLD